VHTFRGKYRQYFLRVNANGEAEYGSANLRVDKDRTLQAVIEAIVRYHLCSIGTFLMYLDPIARACRTRGSSSLPLNAASHSTSDNTDVALNG